MRRVIGIAAGLAAATATFGVSSLPVFGADSGTVAARVSVLAPCLTAAANAPGPPVNFGTLAFGDGMGVGNAISITNCAASTESVYARGTDATSTTSSTTWALYASNGNTCDSGPNKYHLTTYFLKADGQTTGGVAFMTKSNQLLESGVQPGSRNANLNLEMPCGGSDGAGETMSFQVIYTASL